MRKTLIAVMALMAAFLCACTNDNTNSAYTTTNRNANAVAVVSPSATITPARGVPPRGDFRNFVMKAAQGGMAEVEMGRLAAQKGQNAEVKRFGQRMVTDHSKANTELKKLAGTKSIELPTAIGAEEKADVDKLSKLTGAEFDREYMSMMVEDHDKDVAEFQNQAQSGTDADIKAWAAKTLPVLQEHQKLAHDINGKLK